jgi:hypothetical protein
MDMLITMAMIITLAVMERLAWRFRAKIESRNLNNSSHPFSAGLAGASFAKPNRIPETSEQIWL